MVRVSRDTEGASAFRVVVVVGAESIGQPRSGGKTRYRITVHPKRDCRKWRGAGYYGQQVLETKGIAGFAGWERPAGFCLLTIVVITSIIDPSTLEVDHDQRPQKQRTRPRQSRLAGP